MSRLQCCIPYHLYFCFILSFVFFDNVCNCDELNSANEFQMALFNENWSTFQASKGGLLPLFVHLCFYYDMIYDNGVTMMMF